jgi:hypothetical protein
MGLVDDDTLVLPAKFLNQQAAAICSWVFILLRIRVHIRISILVHLISLINLHTTIQYKAVHGGGQWPDTKAANPVLPLPGQLHVHHPPAQRKPGNQGLVLGVFAVTALLMGIPVMWLDKL